MTLKKAIARFGELVVGLMILGCAVYIYLYMNGERSGLTSVRKATLPVVTSDILQTRRLKNQVEALGTGIAKESVDISANTQEKVIEVNFTDGMQVKAGDLLVLLENEQEKASLKQVEVNLAEETRELARIKGLYSAHIASEKDYAERVTSHARAQALYAVAQAALADRIVKAPFDGILGNRLVSVGDLVSPGTLITTLDDISVIKVDFSIPEKYLAKLSLGQVLNVSNIAYPGRRFEGKISAVSVRLNNVTKSVAVRGTIPNINENGIWLLRPGMLLVVELDLGEYDAVMIPEKSVMSLGEIQYIFLCNPDGTVTRREVTTGQRIDGMVELLNGASAGERYVLEGVSKLTDGAAIELSDAKKSGSETK